MSFLNFNSTNFTGDSSFNIQIDNNLVDENNFINDICKKHLSDDEQFSLPKRMRYTNNDDISFKVIYNINNKKPILPNKKNNKSLDTPPIFFSDDLLKHLFRNDPPIDHPQNKNKKLLCNNPNCNHKDFSDDPTPVEILKINVLNIDDLITLGKTYHCKKNMEYNNVSLRIDIA